MKNTNKKGFTLVELVIVIAVIAILAGVLIGTFATVISRANQNSALQKWKAAVDESYVNYVADKHTSPTFVKIDKANGTIVFGDGSENSTDFKALDLYTRTGAGTQDDPYAYAKSNTKMFFVLDENNKVYLLVNNAADSVSYSVVATNDPLVTATSFAVAANTELCTATSKVDSADPLYSAPVDASAYKTLKYGESTYYGQ